MNRPMSFDEFFTSSQLLLKLFKINTIIEENSLIKLSEQVTCSGYFDYEVPELAISKARGGWEGIYIHEFCHVLQWLDNKKLFEKNAIRGSLVDDFLEKNIRRSKKVAKAFLLSARVELDCEERVIKLIDELGLPFDKDSYAQKANAYVLSYFTALEFRRWLSGESALYNRPEIYGKMPTTLVNLDDRNEELINIIRGAYL